MKKRNRLRSLSFAAGIATLAAIMGYAPQSDARLKTYYFLDGLSQGDTTPKVLFVLDTSGSMTWVVRQPDLSGNCRYHQCEDPEDNRASRMAVARDVIRSIVQDTSDNADFSLMSFSRVSPATSTWSTPGDCGNGERFREEEFQGDPMWVLCGTNRPFPYLRHDDLGVGAGVDKPNNYDGPLSSPINDTDRWNDANRARRVQFFPDFLGVQARIDSGLDLTRCANINAQDADSALLYAVCNSYGDYGNNQADRQANIVGRDFYYWPYVDGFPGYSYFRNDDRNIRLGVATNGGFGDSQAATLLAPFFLEQAGGLTDPREPKSRELANQKVLNYVNPMISGGIDASGGTPWADAVGVWVNDPPDTNAPFTHRSVSSYVSYVNSQQESDGVCSPLSVILITDGEPNTTENLYSRISDLRTEGKAETYVVGFGIGGTTLNRMACAAAGSPNSDSPCNYTGSDVTWDTCRNPDNPEDECAYVAANKDELTERLSTIVTGALKLKLEAGPSTSVNEFSSVGPQDPNSSPDAIQTSVRAMTDWPGWRGDVQREVCKDKETDPSKFVAGVPPLAAYCDETKLPLTDLSAERFGTCTLSRNWSAADCLRDTDWRDRRLYFVAPDRSVVPINDATGQPTSQFRTYYSALYDAAAPSDAGAKPSVEAFVEFLLGKDWPENYKLPGLAQSAPIVVRRIPKKNLNLRPTVPIRDPHCAGRKLGSSINIPQSLESFADEAWDVSNMVGSNPHLPYQEAILVGDDMGFLHAFHLDSGNEMWGLLPHFALKSAIASYHHGPENMGQPSKLEDHVFGLGGTVNHTYVYQKPTDRFGNPSTSASPANPGKWRHLAVIGMSQGGNELMALDLSHMSPEHPDGPVEVLWTSADDIIPPGASETLAASYDKILGETWARPAISYHVPASSLDVEPEAIMVLGSGYPSDGAPAQAGLGYHVADPLTGKILDSAQLPTANHPTYDSKITAVADVAVGTHCESRFWGEAQETYFTDPAGRLYRWDLGQGQNHHGDSMGVWTGQARPAATFLACQGLADHDCEVRADNKGEPFHFPPAVVSTNRIDDELAEGLSGIATDQKDNFLIALNSGHLLDQTTDPGREDADFHSSIYLIADDHRASEHHAGISVPPDGAITGPGAHPSFFRLPISQIRRTRTFTPYPGANPIVEENQFFSRRARPVSAPRITVTGLIDSATGEVQEGVEVYYVEFNIFEPGLSSCDPRFYDPVQKKRYQDPGSSYLVRLRLLADDSSGFDFQNGAASVGNNLGADRYGFTTNGLELGTVEQIVDDCEGGACGPKIAQKKFRPCVPKNKFQRVNTGSSVGLGYKILNGFSPIEYDTDADE